LTTRAPAGIGPETVEKQGGEREMAEMVHAEGGLEAVLRLRSARHHQPGVVHEHVETVVSIEELGRELPHRRQAREVEAHDLG
jgi:hypothetical protein